MVDSTATLTRAGNREGGCAIAFRVNAWQKPNGGVFVYLAVMVASALSNLGWLVQGDRHSFVIGIAFVFPGFLVVAGVIAFGPPLLVKGVVDAQGVRGTTWWGKRIAIPWDTVRQGELRVPRNRPSDAPFALVLHPSSGRSCMIAIPRDGYPPEVRFALDALRVRAVEILNIDRLIATGSASGSAGANQ
jgi:hypothetical protein